MSEHDDQLVSTVTCENCGATWPVTEDNPERPEVDRPVKKTDTYRCATCGAATVFEIGLAKIERRHG